MGDHVSTSQRFALSPAHGPSADYSIEPPELAAQARTAAEAAFWTFGLSSREGRARLLEAIAEEIEARSDAITDMVCRETGLPAPRLIDERGRTTGQLRLFASHIRTRDYPDRRFDPALPDGHYGIIKPVV